jgi:HK97 family phage major capsid protein
MKFKDIQEAFNYYRESSLQDIERRAAEIKGIIDRDPQADIAALNIEIDGLQQAKANIIEKQHSASGINTGLERRGWNPITGMNFQPGTNQPQGDILASAEYRSAFFKNLLGQNMTEAEKRIYDAARAEKRADAFNTLTSSAAVVPTETLNEVVSTARPQGGLWNIVRHFNVPANLAVPVGTPTDPAAWHIEGAPVERMDTVTHNVVFRAYELIKILSMSAAAKRMTISAFESYVTQELHASVTEAINAAIVNGNGTGQPQGLLTGITWNATNTVTNTTADAVVEDALKAIVLLPAGYANGAKFVMSNATLFSKIYPVRTGNGEFILMPDVQNGSVRRLFGFEIVVDDNIPADTIIFGNFWYYGVNLPEGVVIETSRESGFANGLIDYRALTIADGKVIVPEAFVKLTLTA